jgi:selenocysteine lyase/cysteine desulfurase
MTDFPIDQVRAQFPALKTRDDGLERIYFDAPGGTQACGPAIARMREHLERGTANSGGAFSSSIETDAMSEAAHAAVADLLGGQPGEIAFGPNMTTLTFSVSRALAKDWGAGDELVLTRLDHDANVAPWLLVARDRGMRVRWIDFDPETGMLDIASLPGLLGPRTRLVAFGGASNALGTLNDIGQICTAVRAHSNALIYVDAVQSVPHVVTDVGRHSAAISSPARPTNSSARIRACFGGGPRSWNGWKPIRCGPPRSIRPPCASKPARPPSKARRACSAPSDISNGSAPSSAIMAAPAEAASDRDDRVRALRARAWRSAAGGLRSIPGLKLWGPPTMDGRVPTFSFTIEGHSPDDIASFLAERGIFAWSGNFYAVEVIARLGLEEKGGLLRVGLCHYSTASEVDR